MFSFLLVHHAASPDRRRTDSYLQPPLVQILSYQNDYTDYLFLVISWCTLKTLLNTWLLFFLEPARAGQLLFFGEIPVPTGCNAITNIKQPLEIRLRLSIRSSYMIQYFDLGPNLCILRHSYQTSSVLCLWGYFGKYISIQTLKTKHDIKENVIRA